MLAWGAISQIRDSNNNVLAVITTTVLDLGRKAILSATTTWATEITTTIMHHTATTITHHSIEALLDPSSQTAASTCPGAKTIITSKWNISSDHFQHSANLRPRTEDQTQAESIWSAAELEIKAPINSTEERETSKRAKSEKKNQFKLNLKSLKDVLN